MRVELLWAETANCTAMCIAYNSAGYMVVNEGSRNFLTTIQSTIAKPVPFELFEASV